MGGRLAWNMDDELKVSQLRDAMFLFRFASEMEALSVLKEGQRWMKGEFLRLDRRLESVGCVEGRVRDGIVAINIARVPIHLWYVQLFGKVGDLF